MPDFRSLPIPVATTNKSALDYHSIPIDMDGEANREPLVRVSDYGIAHRSAYSLSRAPYDRVFDRALPVPLVRQSVARKLRDVNKTLVEFNVELVIWDAYRPVTLQQELWDHFIAVSKDKMPGASEAELVKFVGQYWSDPRDFDPNDFHAWPTHSTGGAVDVTLQDKAVRQELFMGSVFDDVDEVSATRYFENTSLVSLSAADARKNRRLLFHAMNANGFASYHHEWWHYDYGTQMAIMNGAKLDSALYGIASFDESMTNRDRLHDLERDGRYCFHGSGERIEHLEPRQAYNFTNGEKIPDGPPAIFASDLVDYAIFMALINSHNCTGSTFSSCSYENGELIFGASQATLNQLNSKTKGYVHVMARSSFEHRGGCEWMSRDHAVPEFIVEVALRDFKPEIKVVDVPTPD